MVKSLPAKLETQETWVRSLGRQEPLEEKMAWKNPVGGWKRDCIHRDRKSGGLGLKDDFFWQEQKCLKIDCADVCTT